MIYKNRPMPERYIKLRDDLKIALEAGRAAEKANPEDGGSVNHDGVSIALPSWNGPLVRRAAREAGSDCIIWKPYGTRRFVFRPDTQSQGNARSRNAEAMSSVLREMGYDVLDYCQAD